MARDVQCTRIMTTTQHTQTCRGTILVGGSGEYAHRYCSACRAYTYDLDGDVPDGTDAAANRRAWDAGEQESPAEEEVR